jgi:hypothetical protein
MPRWPPPRFQAKKGREDRPESGGPGQTSEQAPRGRRPERDPARRRADCAHVNDSAPFEEMFAWIHRFRRSPCTVRASCRHPPCLPHLVASQGLASLASRWFSSYSKRRQPTEAGARSIANKYSRLGHHWRLKPAFGKLASAAAQTGTPSAFDCRKAGDGPRGGARTTAAAESRRLAKESLLLRISDARPSLQSEWRPSIDFNRWSPARGHRSAPGKGPTTFGAKMGINTSLGDQSPSLLGRNTHCSRCRPPRSQDTSRGSTRHRRLRHRHSLPSATHHASDCRFQARSCIGYQKQLSMPVQRDSQNRHYCRRYPTGIYKSICRQWPTIGVCPAAVRVLRADRAITGMPARADVRRRGGIFIVTSCIPAK